MAWTFYNSDGQRLVKQSSGGGGGASPVQVHDCVAVAFGTGSDSKIYYDGTDTHWDLRDTGTGALMIAVGACHPSPDGNAVHIWEGSAGCVTARSAAMLTLESSTTDEVALQFLMPGGGTSQQAIFFGDSAENTRGSIIYDHGDDHMRIGTAGGTRLTISNDGTYTGSSTNDISDERLKENIENIPIGLAEVLQLRPVKFNFVNGKGWGQPGQKFYGLIAQEVLTVIPEAVHTSTSFDTEFDADQVPDMKSVSMTQITASIIKAIQELNAKVDTLGG